MLACRVDLQGQVATAHEHALRAFPIEGLGTRLALERVGTEVSIMTVLLVILTFAVFILLDYVVARHKAARPVTSPLSRTEPAPMLEPVWVAGYQMPENLYYHRGHTWARALDADTVVVGLDDFARRLIGPASGREAPRARRLAAPGRTRASRSRLDGRAAELVSPVEGEVLEVNRDLRREARAWPPTIPTAAAGC